MEICSAVVLAQEDVVNTTLRADVDCLKPNGPSSAGQSLAAVNNDMVQNAPSEANQAVNAIDCLYTRSGLVC